jgi:hypothetical protein
VAGDGEQRVMQVGITAEALRPADEPKIQLVFEGADIGDQFVLIALGIVDEVPGMYLEKAREEHAAGVGQVRSNATLDLRDVALADRLALLLLDEPDQLLLGQLAIEAAKGSLDFAEVPDFLA